MSPSRSSYDAGSLAMPRCIDYALPGTCSNRGPGSGAPGIRDKPLQQQLHRSCCCRGLGAKGQVHVASTTCCHGSHTHLVNHTIPATTNVAAWIKADTHEGPSIASGSHPCIPNITHLALVGKQSNVLYHASAVLLLEDYHSYYWGLRSMSRLLGTYAS